ncbi:hypothetical protein I4U23_008674 [Adineta vaga]|nr:hypothetical protein I4U23_008674 [Adineta vaga]
MYNKLIILLILKTIDISYATTVQANNLIQSICNVLNDNNSLHAEEDQQWRLICQELSHSKDNHQHSNIDLIDDDIPQNRRPRKVTVRTGGGIRSGGIRSSIGTRTGSSSSSRNRVSASSSSSSSARYLNTRTGITYNRPSGWLWSRSRLIFLPLAIRYAHRSRSSSSRFTTPTSDTTTYYYCTSNDNSSIEIQCSTIYGDQQCCEETNQDAFCCGGTIPDDIEQDMSRTTQTIAQVFYSIATLALFTHLFMRRFYR